MFGTPRLSQDVKKQWKELRGLQAFAARRSRGGFFGSFAFGPGIDQRMIDLAHSLLLISAFGLLDQVLRDSRDSGTIHLTRSRSLGDLMEASRTTTKPPLPWRDHDAVMEGKRIRNTIAHEHVIRGQVECAKIMDIIEAELRDWGLL